ncbi:carbohydrate ABC transporter permease [Nonomuraea endophytica]|uniref:Multiple sugar transport system permease protein n=1 Tax=Nonomuraea endophytica TaxID=714136 RepID=A0A7W8A4Q2_9ACTN|nr:sugar ABC transporter permease [Nonomuraea endophytica]MBB5078696.1 multiple sugar transport system permease protein [Nonomuraea endophytica]
MRTRETWSALGFATPSVLGLGLFTLFPVGMAVVMSFFNWPMLGGSEFIGLDNFRYLFGEDPDFLAALRNTFVFTGLYVPLNILLALGLAFWISNSRWQNLWRVLFFIPAITPMVANAVIFKLLFQLVGTEPNLLADGRTALLSVVAMSVWQGFGYNMIVFSAAINEMPKPVLEAASLDGATGLRRLVSVQLPLISPALFFATTMTVITALQVFTQPYILTAGGPGNATETLVMNVYQAGFQSRDLGLAAAAAWVLFAIILVVTFVQFLGQKRWVHYES